MRDDAVRDGRGTRAPIKPREVANGIVYRDELEGCGSRLGPNDPRNIAIRKTNFELVRLREIVRRLRSGQ
jgi:hypothetical protein